MTGIPETAWNLMMQGNLIEGIIYPFTALIGNYFYVLLYLLGFAMVYNKNQSFSTAGILGLVVASPILAFVPVGFHFIAYTFIVLAVTIVIYKVFA